MTTLRALISYVTFYNEKFAKETDLIVKCKTGSKEELEVGKLVIIVLAKEFVCFFP